MLKVVTVVGTRPELIKLSRVIAELDKHAEHILVHTGQNYDYEMNEVFFQDLDIRKPDYFLDVADKNAAQAIANIISRVDDVLEKEKPEAFLIYGDTNSCLSVIAAKRRRIPVFHMEAGNRCFDQRVPEEINRKIVDHLSDINMPISEHARDYLVSEGLKPETIIKVGSSMKEVLEFARPKIERSDVLERLELKQKGYFLVSIHREENVDNPKHIQELLDTIDAISTQFDKKVIVSTHPRTRKKLEAMGFNNSNDRVEFMKPFGFIDYIKLQSDAFCVLSDSGTISEESSLLGFPSITIREAHERPEAMDEATLIMSGVDKQRIVDAVDIVVDQYQSPESRPSIVSDYNTDNLSKKILKIIYSYTDYVNRTVWKEYA